MFFFKKKTTKLNYQSTQYEKKVKLTKTILLKTNKEKRKKTTWENSVAINSVFKKKLQS
jgi:hypothetical protein